jgi:carboxypeptidase C (cathepsin A)
MRIPSLFTALLFLFACTTVSFAEETKEDKTNIEIPEAMSFVSNDVIKINGQTIEYTATAGTLMMKDKDDKPIALFGYTSYVKKGGDRNKRPILFAYNGGPGSASMWLHMGILGPQRTVVTDTEFTTTGPFKRVSNEFSVLANADLVMIDPVGTGFSQPVGEAKGEDFWGVDQDIESVSNFIARYVTDNGRWSSPKYLLGESYGGIRSGGVAHYLLSRHSMSLNGVILVSPYMDFIAGNAGLKLDLPYINFFTTYASTAWYHEAITDRPDDLQVFLREAEAFAIDVYAPVLLKGHRATAEERAVVLAGMERFTGISADYWDKANLRIREDQFTKELLRDRKMNVGRIDSRFTGEAINHISESMGYDPFFPAVGPAFVATFNDYYREELGVKTDRKYVTSAGLWQHWDESHAQPGAPYSGKVPFANTAVDLAHTMIQNPNMRVLVQQGYFDLATPYGATNYFIDHMDMSPALRENIQVEYYNAGHMMYLHPPSMEKFSKDLASFIGD